MTIWNLQERLAEIIDMLLDRYPMGMRVLIGEADPPTIEEIYEMYAAGRGGNEPDVRVEGGERVTRAEQMVFDSERFEEVVKRAGGWDHINRTAQEWEAYNPNTWRVVEEHTKWDGRGAFRRLDEARMVTMAGRLGLAAETIRRYRREFPRDLAGVILRSCPKTRKNSISGAA